MGNCFIPVRMKAALSHLLHLVSERSFFCLFYKVIWRHFVIANLLLLFNLCGGKRVTTESTATAQLTVCTRSSFFFRMCIRINVM